jgi:hypothetical protein
MQELPCTNECTRTPIDVMNRIGKMVNEENGDIIEDVRATYIHILMYSQSNRIVELFAPNKKIQKLFLIQIFVLFTFLLQKFLKF